MVSAFAARQHLVLGHDKVADKANEIIAIPKLPNMLAIEGAIVTIDAMGCQRGIARTRRDNKSDYVLALKGNQGALHTDVELLVAEQKTREFADTRITRDTMVDGDHGRIETRTTTGLHAVDWLQNHHDWPVLEAVVMVEGSRETNGKIEYETPLYLTSLVMVGSLMGPIMRSHWAIENSLHWLMDMVVRDDECRVRTDHTPANFTTIKHIAHNLLRTAGGKDSLCLRRKVAAWDDDFLTGIIAR